MGKREVLLFPKLTQRRFIGTRQSSRTSKMGAVYYVTIDWSPKFKSSHWLHSTLALSSAKLSGFLVAAETLFPKKYLRIWIQGSDGTSEEIRSMFLRKHILVSSRVPFRYNSWTETWDKFVERMIGRNREELGRYTCILYGCENHNLIQFDSFEFLEGAQALCELFHVECRDQVQSLHDREANFLIGVKLLANSYELNNRPALQVA